VAGTVYDRLGRVFAHVTMAGYIRALGGKAEDGDKPQRIACPLPDHEDEHPSARLFPDSGVVHCFSCGFHGDMVDLHQKARDCDILTALSEIEDQFSLHDLPFVRVNNQPFHDPRTEAEDGLLALWMRARVRFREDLYYRDLDEKLVKLWLRQWENQVSCWGVTLRLMRQVILCFAATRGLYLEAQI